MTRLGEGPISETIVNAELAKRETLDKIKGTIERINPPEKMAISSWIALNKKTNGGITWRPLADIVTNNKSLRDDIRKASNEFNKYLNDVYNKDITPLPGAVAITTQGNTAKVLNGVYGGNKN